MASFRAIPAQRIRAGDLIALNADGLLVPAVAGDDVVATAAEDLDTPYVAIDPKRGIAYRAGHVPTPRA